MAGVVALEPNVHVAGHGRAFHEWLDLHAPASGSPAANAINETRDLALDCTRFAPPRAESPQGELF